MASVALIAAVASNGVIGNRDALVWRLPEDLRFLRRMTLGHTVVMGRRTWDSLPDRFRPLPGRRNIVVTRDPGWSGAGAEAAESPAAAIARVADDARVFVIGGAALYAATLASADELLLTEIEREFDGDTCFPTFDRAIFVESARERHRAAPPNDFDFSFVRYRRAR